VPLALRRERVDVVFSTKHSIPLAAFAPRVFMLHGADWIAFPENYYAVDRLYHRVALPLYLKSAERVITISHDSARRILDYMPEVAPKLSVVHHGLPPGFAPVGDGARRAAMRARHGLPERFLLYVGQVYPHKNVGGILRALALLRDRIPHPLVMVGRPSLKAERDMRLVEQLGLGDRVRFTGWVADEDLPVLYSLADAFVFPSLYEGFGVPLLEAMACGCPVVTSTGGSCAEVVGEAGLCVDPADPAAIAGAVLRVVTEPGLARELGRRGVERARRFTWERTARATLSILAEAAGRSQTQGAAAA
jgi:glycosyltransferase involved in cell wall biosynthesis